MTVHKDRNYGIDLLRMVSMMLVVVLHVEGHGGVLEAAQGHAVYWAYLPESFAYSAVNCYALISGYVGFEGRWRPANLIRLWMQVCFYSVGITALYGLAVPGSVGVTDLLHAALPVTYQYVDYWYFTAYFGLFFLIPLLNYLVCHMPRAQLRAALASLLLVFSVLPTVMRHDRFCLSNGYSVWWLAILYLLGGYLKRYNALKRFRGSRALLLYVGFSLLSYLLRMGADFLARHVAAYAWIGERFFGAQAIWLNYLSPTVLAAAIFLVLFFADLPLPARLVAVVRRVSPLAFGVYLIHNHPLVGDYWMDGRFADLAALPGPLLVLAVVAVALAIYLACTLLDGLRAGLFRLLRLRDLANWLEQQIRAAWGRVLAFL